MLRFVLSLYHFAFADCTIEFLSLSLDFVFGFSASFYFIHNIFFCFFPLTILFHICSVFTLFCFTNVPPVQFPRVPLGRALLNEISDRNRRRKKSRKWRWWMIDNDWLNTLKRLRFSCSGKHLRTILFYKAEEEVFTVKHRNTLWNIVGNMFLANVIRAKWEWYKLVDVAKRNLATSFCFKVCSSPEYLPWK